MLGCTGGRYRNPNYLQKMWIEIHKSNEEVKFVLERVRRQKRRITRLHIQGCLDCMVPSVEWRNCLHDRKIIMSVATRTGGSRSPEKMK